MQKKILDILRENARADITEIAARLGKKESDVAKAIRKLEKDGVIRGYTAILDDRAGSAAVRALIEVKVSPRRDGGFDKVATRIAKFPEVSDLLLVSGSYDLLVTVEGDTLQDVASFVAAKLSTIDGVLSCATAFQLKKYKESGRIMKNDEDYERLKICP